MKTEEKVYLIAKAASGKKADDIISMYMKRPTQICDYFVIASGNSARQVRAISDNIEETTRQKGIKSVHVEGYEEGAWVLMDYHDVVVHIFMKDTREFYNLERLWADAPKRSFNNTEGIVAKECWT